MRTVARRPRILVVDDDETVSDIVTRYLEREAFEVRALADGQLAVDSVEDDEPDLIVLDLMLPGLSGFEVCQRLRARRLPVVILSARGEESDRIMGLELGAADYVVKPFSPLELVARIRSVLRRSGLRRAAGPISVGALVLDPGTRIVTAAGRTAVLTAREFDLLAFLMEHPRRVFSREELLDQVWGHRFGGTPTVTVHVQRLRRKFERDPERPEYVKTVRGAGYRLDP